MDDVAPIQPGAVLPAAPGPPANEAEFVTQLRGGSDAAFERLVREQIGRLLVVAERITRHADDAQDAVQEALVSAYRAIGQFDGRSKLSTWLHRITVNAALMKVRSRKRRGERSIEELLPTFQEDGHHSSRPAPWRSSPGEALLRDETRRLVRQRIDELPESYRTVLVLRDIEEMDTAETARALGVSEGVVKTRLHRARQALRTLLDREFSEVQP